MKPDDPRELLKRYEPKAGPVLNPARPLCTVRFSPCGTMLAAGGTDARIHRWDLTGETPSELPSLAGHSGWVQAIAFHPDGKRLISVDSWGKVCCWLHGEADPTPCWTIDAAHDGWIRGLALSPDGTLAATCGSDGQVCVWTTGEGTKTHAFSGHAVDVLAVAFHPGGTSLVSGDLKGTLKQWDLGSPPSVAPRRSVLATPAVRTLDAQVLYKYERIQDVGGVRALRFDSAGRVLACAGCKPRSGASLLGTPTILLFDWDSGQVTHTMKVGNDVDGLVYDLAWHPDGFLMAVSSGNPGTGKFFFIQPGAAQPFFLWTRMPNCQALDVHPDGRRLVVSATNANSNGNGRRIGKATEHPGNWSPLHFWALPRSS
jgi:WD40 repeat protein